MNFIWRTHYLFLCDFYPYYVIDYIIDELLSLAEYSYKKKNSIKYAITNCVGFIK